MTFSDSIARTIDASIGIFAPDRALKRAASRRALVELGAYSGAKTTRISNGWITEAGSPQADIDTDLPILRARSRDLYQNNGKATGIIDRLVTGVVGQGIRPQPRLNEKLLGISPDAARDYEDWMKEYFRQWVPFADAGNRMDFYGSERQCVHNWFSNGEAFYLAQSVDSQKSPISFRLMGIESDRVKTPMEYTEKDGIFSGIRIGAKYGEPLSYFISKSHPGDNFLTRGKFGDYSEVKAEDKMGRKMVMHVFTPSRSGQMRGVPLFSSVLNLFDSQQGYLEAELVRARLRACIGLVVNEGSSAYGHGGEITSLNDKNYEGIEPGQIWRFERPDAKVSQIESNAPGDNFDPFIRELDRTIANAVGLTYEIAMGDYSHATYSSLRAAYVEIRRRYRVLQRQFEHSFCQPVWEWFLDEAVLSGLLFLPNYWNNRTAWQKVIWTPDGYDWVDPSREVEAALAAINGNIATISQTVAERTGTDWRDTVEQRGEEVAALKEAGLIVEVQEEEKPQDKKQNQEKEEQPNEST